MQQKVISNSFNVTVVRDGENGKDGKGVVNVNIYYLAAASPPPTPSGAPPQTGWADDGNSLIIADNADKHLYESSCSTYTDGSYSWTRPVDDGLIRDMASAQEQFALSSSGTAQPTSGWATSVTPQKGKWIWSRTVLTFKDGSTKVVGVQCVGYCGDDGHDGNGIVSITNTFALSAQGTTASETTAPVITGSWSTVQPKPTAEHPYLWRREVTVYTDTSKNTTKYFLVAARGGDGNHGHTGRFYYFAGNYDGTPGHYRIEETQAPYVKVGTKFYMLDLGGVEPGTIPYAATQSPSDSSTEWTLMQSAFAYYIAQAFFGENAYLGSFIINGDWMITKHGLIFDSTGGVHLIDDTHSYSGYSTNNAYTLFDPSYPNSSRSGVLNFCPAWAVDGLVGRQYHNGVYDTNKAGSVSIDSAGFAVKWGGEGFRVGSEGLQRYDSVRDAWLPMYNKRNIIVDKNSGAYYMPTDVDYLVNGYYNPGQDIYRQIYLPNSANMPDGAVITVRGLSGCYADVRRHPNSNDILTWGDSPSVEYVEVESADRVEFVLYKGSGVTRPTWYINWFDQEK